MSPDELKLHHVRADEHAQLRALRLAALRSDPDAFGATYAHEAERPAGWWESWAAASDAGVQQRTFVLMGAGRRWAALAMVRLEADDSGSARLLAMWVGPEARGRGAAVRLCEACAEWAHARGCRELSLAVVVGNEPALRAYRRAGFSIRTTTTWVRDDGQALEEFIMTRPLGA